MTTALPKPRTPRKRPAPTKPPMVGVRIGPEGAPPPERTLGWNAIMWAREYLLQPDGPQAGDPWEFTREQKLFVANWYAIDARGRFVYRSGMLRRMKGWGKDPVGAVLCAIEFVGPCRFAGWNPDGTPRAEPHSAAWVQTAAVSKDQTRNTMTLFPGLFARHTLEEYGIDLGKEIIYAHRGQCRIEAVTSSPRALEGGRATFILKNETHHWLSSNEGLDMSAVIARNAAKSRDGSSRVLAISNAHNPGEDSDAEHDYEAQQNIATGRSIATGFLYDSLEAPPNVELVARGTGRDGQVTEKDRARARESLRQGLMAARGDSHWLDVDRLIEEIYDPRTTPSTSRRYYLNHIIAAEDAWLAPHEWDRCADASKTVAAGEMVTLGFDGSKTDDHTVLMACRVEDSHLFPLGAWEPANYGDNEIPRLEIDAAVEQAFAEYDVVGFYSDVHPWESYVDKWEQDHTETLCARAQERHPIGWDMRAKKLETTKAAEAYHDAIVERDLTHSGDKRIDQYHYNARRRPNNYGVTFGKESPFSSRKVDGAAAAMLARKARQDYLALPENKKRQVTQKAGVFWA